MTRLWDIMVGSMDPVGIRLFAIIKVVRKKAITTAATIIWIQLMISFFRSKGSSSFLLRLFPAFWFLLPFCLLFSAKINVGPDSASHPALPRTAPVLSPDLPIPVNNILGGGQLLKPHGPSCVELLGTDSNLRAESELLPVRTRYLRVT